MAKENSNNARLGIFVTVAAILFTVAVYYIGNQQNLFGDKFSISSIFHNVNGLQKGNNVRYAGINVGIVNDIIIINDSTIQVDMMLNSDVRKFVRKDAIASIGSDGLVGNMIVNITPGPGNAEVVSNGDLIDSFSRVKTDDMMSTLGSTTETISLLALNLLEISENINRGEGSLPMLINDASLAKNMQIMMNNLRVTSESINRMTKELENNIAQLNDGQGALGYMLKDTTFGAQVNQITDAVDSLVRIQTAPIMANLEKSSKELSNTTENLQKLIKEIDLNQGLAGAVLKDPKAAEDLKKTLSNLNEGTEKFNENMEALKYNFLFRSYFKKQERKVRREEKKASSN
ncbi:MAG: MCE family protein [Bacteroidia bacterium]|nr:MCE family protein [Bacteroidia bacterium]